MKIPVDNNHHVAGEDMHVGFFLVSGFPGQYSQGSNTPQSLPSLNTVQSVVKIPLGIHGAARQCCAVILPSSQAGKGVIGAYVSG